MSPAAELSGARARSPAQAGTARRSGPLFFGVAALVFSGSVAVTVSWCASMSAMAGMPMPGGWTMSMAWMRMPEQTWTGAAAAFLAMWTVMMIAMMLPSLLPMLWRYRRSVAGAGAARPGGLMLLASVGYFAVWMAFGMVAYLLGVALASVEMRVPALARAVPIAAAAVMVIAGRVQLSPWKMRHLACCRAAPDCDERAGAGATAAWRQGLRFGLRCARCSGALMVILLIVGVMDLITMGLVMAAVTAERLAPAGERIARAIGVIILGAGLVLAMRAIGHG